MKHLLAIACLVVAACGPTVLPAGGDDQGGGGPDAGPVSCDNPQSETSIDACNDGVDNDCDGKYDCDDPDCSGVGECPVCGEVQTVLGQPFALPDDGTGTMPYLSTLNFTGFPANATLPSIDKFLGVCVNMEHSWLRDLQIELITPDNRTIVLQQMLGQTGSEIYMGQPNDNDDVDPIPGVGMDYCWTPTATNPPMLDYVNANPANAHPLPPGDYQASGGWTQLVGVPLDGNWSIKVTDLWAIDNGYIFNWTIKFDPNLVDDCSGPIVN